MSQNDYVIANQTTPLFRADLNSALQALASTSSGATAPDTTYANMLWYDTAADTLYMRSEADDAWITLGTLNQGNNTFTPSLVGVPTQTQAVWNTGTDTTESLISAAKLDAKLDNYEQQVGVGQTWQNLTGSRSTGGVSYQNTTGKPIFISISIDGGSNNELQASVNNSTWVIISDIGAASGDTNTVTAVIPDTHYYRFIGTPDTLFNWSELR